MMRVSFALILTLVAMAAPAQMATSATHQLESYAITGGGNLATSATHQLWGSLGQPTPLSIAVTPFSATHALQVGLIPTLYPRTRLGDANDDGILDAADVVTAVGIANGSVAVPTRIVHIFNTDANTDLQIDAADVGAIADLVIGL